MSFKINRFAISVLVGIFSVLFLPFFPNALALGADSPPIKIASWASPVGSQALTYESLCGLRSLLSFLNANHGLDREAQLFSLDMDDSHPEFLTRLGLLLDQKKPDLVVGGAASAFPRATSEFLKRRGLLWYGPWSNSQRLINQGDNPTLLLPTEDQELAALMGYMAKTGRKEAVFVHVKSERSKEIVVIAEATAAQNGLTLRLLPVAPEFRNWPSLLEPLKEAEAIFLWLPPGPSAAVARSLKDSLNPQTLWLTHSLNSPGHELVTMTAGLWENTIFPAVLIPKETIPPNYDVVIRKYGPPGLSLDYQTYLGFAQGQILARALKDSKALTPESLPQTPTEGTLIFAPPQAGNLASFYLAISDREGGWRPAN
ncbi:MAG: ABC transporter substrate-binding protein [Deltaproteobacteria bacterium]|nr:ABC transporter substrate-binding protein [Deltaproteobacteria bacterium]